MDPLVSYCTLMYKSVFQASDSIATRSTWMPADEERGRQNFVLHQTNVQRSRLTAIGPIKIDITCRSAAALFEARVFARSASPFSCANMRVRLLKNAIHLLAVEAGIGRNKFFLFVRPRILPLSTNFLYVPRPR